MVKDEVDPRGSSIPNPPVSGLAELLERNRAVPKNKSKDNSSEPKTQQQQPAQPSAFDIDISKLDIRVGVITKAWEHDQGDKLFCEEIDIGEESPRQIASGLRDHYQLQDLEGQRVLVLANLKARKLMGFPSHGMVLCALNKNDGTVKLVEPPKGAAIGERVFVEGFEGEPATENQVVKKKMLEAIFPDLATDANGVACYRNVPLQTSAGPCQGTFPNAAVA